MRVSMAIVHTGNRRIEEIEINCLAEGSNSNAISTPGLKPTFKGEKFVFLPCTDNFHLEAQP